MDFDNAQSGLEIFKAIFFIVVGAGASIGFIHDFVENKWTFER